MATLAAKNYSMEVCHKCKGLGGGQGWTCTNCDGHGKVSKYPPVYVNNRDTHGNWIGSVRNENGWTP